MFVERLDQVTVQGDRALLAQLVDAAPPRVEIPAPVSTAPEPGGSLTVLG